MQSAQLQRQSKSFQGSRTTSRVETVPDSLGFARLGRCTPDTGYSGRCWEAHRTQQDSLQLAPARQWRAVFSPESGQLLLHLPSSRKVTSLVKDAPTHTILRHQLPHAGSLIWMPDTLASTTHSLRHSGSTSVESWF